MACRMVPHHTPQRAGDCTPWNPSSGPEGQNVVFCRLSTLEWSFGDSSSSSKTRCNDLLNVENHALLLSLLVAPQSKFRAKSKLSGGQVAVTIALISADNALVVRFNQ